jgi:glycosyltransferase involved in cell wall biosynthesis
MRIAVVISSIDISRGGPAQSSVGLCHALSQGGLDITLFTCKPIGEVPSLTGKGFTVHEFERSWPRRYSNSGRLIGELAENGRSFDIIDISGLWDFTTARAASAAIKIGIPFVITPHGMISAWHRGIAGLHKEVFYQLVHRPHIKRAAVLRFLTRDEAEASLRIVGNMEYVVVPNGIWPDDYRLLDPRSFRCRHGLADRRLVTFLGRLHGIKRLDLQCEAFKILAPRFPDLCWVFIGPDDGCGAYIRSCMKDARLLHRTIMPGLLSGDDKLSALAATTVYCHTSEHEGHSMAITEALACGKPCVVTRGCHFDGIEAHNAGFITSTEPSEIAGAITRILEDNRSLVAMGENAQQFVFDEYAWSKIAAQMIAVYKWVLRRGPRPCSLRFN